MQPGSRFSHLKHEQHQLLISKFPARRSREFFGWSREFFGSSREFCERSKDLQIWVPCRALSRWEANRLTSNDLESETDPGQRTIYQIRVQSHLGSDWTAWFEGLTITLEDNGDTLLTGPVQDQAALHGLLKKLRDLGLPLLSVNVVESGQADTPDVFQNIIGST